MQCDFKMSELKLTNNKVITGESLVKMRQARELISNLSTQQDNIYEELIRDLIEAKAITSSDVEYMFDYCYNNFPEDP